MAYLDQRSAEAMTIFRRDVAGMFPAIHMGRPWDAFFYLPYPTTGAAVG